MITTYSVKMDLWGQNSAKAIPVAQDDAYSRALEISLYAGKDAWEIPEGATPIIRYCKSDGSWGQYDTMPDGSRAWEADGNRLRICLAPQMLTRKGSVAVDVMLVEGAQVLSTFTIYLNVAATVNGTTADSGSYRRITGFMPLPSGAEVGQAVVVKTVDSGGRPTAVETRPYCIAQQIGTSETAVMSQKAVTDAIVQGMQAGPEFVSSLTECTDTSKVYVLSDGFLYAYMRSVSEQNPNVFDPDAATLNVRLNSSGAEVALNGSYCTGFIPVDLTALDPYIVRLPADFHGSYGNQRAVLYDANKKVLQNCYINNKGAGDLISYVYVDTDGRYYIQLGYHGEGDTLTAPDDTLTANARYVRFSILLNESATALTEENIANAEINFDALYVREDNYAWCNTGRAYLPADYEDRIVRLEDGAADHAGRIASAEDRVTALESGVLGRLPAYWKDYLPFKIKTVNNLQEAGGRDCFSFPVLTDVHISSNLGKHSGNLIRAMMDGCDMRYALCLGDVVTRGAGLTEEAMTDSFGAAEKLLEPVRACLLQTQGNHDGAWGAEDLDLDGDVEGNEYYCRNFTPRKLHRLIYRKVGLVGNAHFDATGSGYYVDDVSNKVRFILLNSHCHPYAENSDGTAKYNTMRLFRFRQAQYHLLTEALSSVPGDDWAVVSASHVPLNDDYAEAFGGEAGDHILMRRLLAAYRNKTPFSGSFAGTYGFDAVDVQVDFTKAKGMYIAHFAGHCHADTSGVYDGITVITTRCDGHEENDVTSALYKERQAGTTTEQSFDIFTVNRSTGTVYATKIGAGSDRIISI